MKKRVEILMNFFESRIAECTKSEKELIMDERRDEANFEKIKANVFDIFKTVLTVAKKTCGDNAEAVQCFFLKKLETIPANWEAAYEKAQQHGDAEKMLIESIKLGAAQQIKAEFSKVWEETI